jgi:hypothetical protein
MLGPRLLKTPQDFLEMAFSSAGVSLPAPGISRSITNFGMVVAPHWFGGYWRAHGARLGASVLRLSSGRLETRMKFV